VLRNFDRLCAEARQCGPLSVPAWGANTERTEFAFLTGMSPEQMGMHRFNPYRLVARGWPVAALPCLLKGMGYRTVAVHPHYGAFYGRDRIFRQLGFDEFLDIRAFAGARHVGAYVADAEVGDRIAEILRGATEPTFVFAVTMENHGPLHLEHVEQGDAERLYAAAPPPGCDDLTVYLRHLSNADGMFGTLREVCLACGRPASLCIYGDHVPIMPQAYAALGLPGGDVPYVLWDSRSAQQEAGEGSRRELMAHDLAVAWLQASISGCAVAEGAHGSCALSAGRQS
jgi:phosphoglycerol transferase MdoB-like AlkP superfamily enzyme